MSKNLEGRILGIDYGQARLGLALSCPNRVIAFPYKTLVVRGPLAEAAALTAKEIATLASLPAEIVIGLPLMMNGTRGSMAEEVQKFSDMLKAELSLPVTLWDERLTTTQADRSLKEANLSRKKRSRTVDGVAAVLILQSYLDCCNRGSFS